MQHSEDNTMEGICTNKHVNCYVFGVGECAVAVYTDTLGRSVILISKTKDAREPGTILDMDMIVDGTETFIVAPSAEAAYIIFDQLTGGSKDDC